MRQPGQQTTHTFMILPGIGDLTVPAEVAVPPTCAHARGTGRANPKLSPPTHNTSTCIDHINCLAVTAAGTHCRHISMPGVVHMQGAGMQRCLWTTNGLGLSQYPQALQGTAASPVRRPGCMS